MTETQIMALHSRKAELRAKRVVLELRLRQVYEDDLANNLTCDHLTPHGSLARSEDRFLCAICGCGGGRNFADPIT